jgi:hemolysin activation/secretion protein
MIWKGIRGMFDEPHSALIRVGSVLYLLFATVLFAASSQSAAAPADGSKVSGQAPSTNSTPGAVTNVSPRFPVEGYRVIGNTLLPDATLQQIFSKHTGTNLTIAELQSALSELQLTYRDRGYPTVKVTLPEQKITNGIVEVRILEGRLEHITISGNHYFSSNNIMAALPSLKTNIILNRDVFQSELDRANANRDRQIYPQINPGPDPETTALALSVKDRLPLHAQLDVNNLNSPGTPALRLNLSAVYNNLWQLEHSVGVQYSVAPDVRKRGDWDWYDLPLVANYGAYYRMPLSGPAAVAEEVANQPGSFGYDEATRKFRLPPLTGQPEFNVFASRSTIDTGVEFQPPVNLFTSTARNVNQQNVQQDITINQGIGARLSVPLQEFDGIRSSISLGFDYKSYRLTTFATNDFLFVEHLFNEQGVPFDRISTIPSPVPATVRSVSYVPLTFRWDANWRDPLGSWDFGFNYSPNFSGTFLKNRGDFANVAGSSHADGYYHVLNASLGRDQVLYKQWRLSLRADGQWANQPLISNEQFGDGGAAGVRGYHEGEVFGDTGWRVVCEPKTPALLVGLVDNKYPLVARGSIFMDYGESYLLDPNGRQGRVPLWGTGIGMVGSIGNNLDTKLTLAWPLRTTPSTRSGRALFSFSLRVQF